MATMSPKCRTAIMAAAAGRPVSAAKMQAIEDLLRNKGQQLAKQDRQRWLGLTPAQRTAEIAQETMADLAADAARKVQNAQMQTMATAAIDTRIQEAVTVAGGTHSQGYALDLVHTGQHIDGVRDEALSTLKDLLDAASSKEGVGPMRNLLMRVFDIENPGMTADIAREVYKGANGSTGNNAAKAAARAWLDTIEQMRVRANELGANIGKLGYGYLTQIHAEAKILKAGAQAWVTDVLPWLDRSQYVRADGNLMGDAEITGLLESAYKTLSTGGDINTPPGSFQGSGATANRGSEHRVLHFADGDAYMAYMAKYGADGSLYDSMMGHVSSMARDIGLMERMGPNATQQHRLQADLANRADKHSGFFGQRTWGGKPDSIFRIVSGQGGQVDSQGLANFGRNVRNVEVFSKLGSTLWTALGGDMGTTMASLHYNRLPYFEMMKNLGKMATQQDFRDTVIAHGVISETLVHGIDRFIGDNLTHNLTGNIAHATLKLTMVNALTNGIRSAFSVTLSGGLAKTSRLAWGSLDEWDRYLYGKAGITEADWAIMNQVTPTQDLGGLHLTARAIRESGIDGAVPLAAKISGFLKDESHFASVQPDVGTRSIVTGGGVPAGSPTGEIWRSVAQFHSFPMAMVSRHLRRIWDTPQGLEGAPLGYGADTAAGALAARISVLTAFTLSLGLLSAIGVQAKQLLAGKDPLDMVDWKFWGKAMAMGGGLSYLGDFLTKDPTEKRGDNMKRYLGLLGPAAGTFGEIVDLTWGNAWQAGKGAATHMGAETIRLINNHLPGVNMWQVRMLWERYFLDHAQELANPGYLGRVQRRAQKDWNQAYFWPPGETAPTRAPDLERAVGQ